MTGRYVPLWRRQEVGRWLRRGDVGRDGDKEPTVMAEQMVPGKFLEVCVSADLERVTVESSPSGVESNREAASTHLVVAALRRCMGIVSRGRGSGGLHERGRSGCSEWGTGWVFVRGRKPT